MVSESAVELQTGEILVEISVDDLRLRIWEIIRPWNWGVSISSDVARISECSRHCLNHNDPKGLILCLSITGGA